MTTLLIRNEYGKPEVVEQVCSRCGEPVEWLKQRGTWSPTNPGTGKFHVCKKEE